MNGRKILPVATAAQVRSYARRLTLRHPRELAWTLVLYGAAAACGLIGPRLVGDLVGRVQTGHAHAATVDGTVLAIVAFVIGQAVLTRFAVAASAKLGEKVLALLREEFVGSILALPLATVERAGMGDLVTRTTRDVDALSRSVRRAVPETLIAVVTGLLAVGALVLVGPLLALPCLTAVPLLWGGTRWYLARARDGYLRENASWAEVTASLAETVEGARTIEVFGLQRRRNQQGDEDIATCYAAERYTLGLRTRWFPIIETGYVLPIAVTLLVGGLYYIYGLADLAQVTAATLYVQQLIDPIDRLLSWIDELQVGGAALARLLGVADTSDEPRSGHRSPDGEAMTIKDVRFSYRAGHDVLHGVDLRLRQGERLAVVGPSGAGKSTLGRLIAGVMPPGSGSVTVGGVPLTDLPLEDLRGHVALVTQEHHVFLGSIADNLRLARPAATTGELAEALRAVDAWSWVSGLPGGIDTQVGSLDAPRDGAGHSSGEPAESVERVKLSPAQAQQLSLARVILADPHTLVLDEATSLLDPRAARHLERSLAAILEGRTVVAIAHRLQTAHDADRVAVVEGGRITELGTHDELIEACGSYSALWRSWHGG